MSRVRTLLLLLGIALHLPARADEGEAADAGAGAVEETPPAALPPTVSLRTGSEEELWALRDARALKTYNVGQAMAAGAVVTYGLTWGVARYTNLGNRYPGVAAVWGGVAVASLPIGIVGSHVMAASSLRSQRALTELGADVRRVGGWAYLGLPVAAAGVGLDMGGGLLFVRSLYFGSAEAAFVGFIGGGVIVLTGAACFVGGPLVLLGVPFIQGSFNDEARRELGRDTVSWRFTPLPLRGGAGVALTATF